MSKKNAKRWVAPPKENPKPIEEVVEQEVYEDAVIEGAGMLNIRSTPEVKDGNVIGIFPDKTPAKVLKNKDGGDWWKIIVGSPEVKGYAMRKYITIK